MLTLGRTNAIDWPHIIKKMDDMDAVKNAIIVERSNRDVLYSSPSLNRIFDVPSNPVHNRFGNLVQCEHVQGTQDACGTKRQCSSCRLKNSIEAFHQMQFDVTKFRFNKKYMHLGSLCPKWFAVQLRKHTVKSEEYVIIELSEKTQMVQDLIENELAIMEKTLKI